MSLTPRRGGPSRTAQAVAAGRAIGLRGLHDPYAVQVLSDGRRRLVHALRRTIEASPAGETVVNTLTAGLAGHATLRMDAIDRALHEALSAGCGQVVILGAGFDTRAWRLEALAGRHLVEVDLPAIQSLKQRRLATVTPLTPVVFAAADLAEDPLADALSTTGHDDSLPTVWIWEAVAAYLPRSAVLDTVDAIAELSAVGSHLAMTVAHPDLVGSGAISAVLSPAAKGLFAGIGEPLRSTFADADITTILQEAGFQGVRCSGPDEWARGAGRTPLPDPYAAERLVTAHR